MVGDWCKWKETEAGFSSEALFVSFVYPTLLHDDVQLFCFKELLQIPHCLSWWYCNIYLENQLRNFSSEFLASLQLYLQSDKQNKSCSLEFHSKNPKPLAPTRKIKLLGFHLFWFDSKIQGVMQLKPGICFGMLLVWQQSTSISATGKKYPVHKEMQKMVAFQNSHVYRH